MAALGLVAAATGWSPAGADEITSLEARANADGFRYTFGAPGFVAVDTFIDGGGPVSQSVLDGLGNSQSFASLPYPSDNAISGPGLVAGLTGLPSPPPSPFYVTSSYPTQEQAAFAQPGIDLKANSTETGTDGTATSGGGQGDSAVFRISSDTAAAEPPPPRPRWRHPLAGAGRGSLRLRRVRSSSPRTSPPGLRSPSVRLRGA